FLCPDAAATGQISETIFLEQRQSCAAYDRRRTMENLNGLKVAILVENGFEWVELVEPRKALDQAGAETRIVSPRDKHVRAWNFTNWGDQFPVDVTLDQAKPRDFGALLLPG